jgi:hypothetical protein
MQQGTFLGLDQTEWILIGVILLLILVGYVIFQASINHKEVLFGFTEVMQSLAA